MRIRDALRRAGNSSWVMAYGSMFKIFSWVYYVFIISAAMLIGAALGGMYGPVAFLTILLIFVGPLWYKVWKEGGRRNEASASGGDQKSWKNQDAATGRFIQLVKKDEEEGT